jgi:uncharacterized membrane protein YvbJ
MNENQAICLGCGVQKRASKNYCENCGAQTNPNAVICTNCGVSLQGGNGANAAPGTYLNGQDKTLIAIICFFLGGLGIHNFMLGETKKGVFKIIMAFVCGISAIFALIDFIKILTNTYVVDPDKLI